MVVVAQKELERVFAYGQGHGRFRLPCAEMKMIEIARYRIVQRRQLGIDQEVMVTRVGPVDSRRGNSHVSEPKVKGWAGRQNGTILYTDEENLRTGR